MVGNLARLSAAAIVPDQLVPYVSAVSGLESSVVAGCALHQADGQAVLVAYPPGDPLSQSGLDEAVRLACQQPGIGHITVLAAARPAAAPPEASSSSDFYWQLDLPPAPYSGKLKNMLRSAGRGLALECASGPGAWSAEHAALVADFCARKGSALGDDTVYLFGQLGKYLDQVPDALLFSARTGNNELAGMAICDYTALGTAFYMFAFRSRKAPPGTADLLLDALIAEAVRRGHSWLNLGLGINPGIEFFKRKWGARMGLPCVETGWSLARQKPERKSGWFRRLFGG